MGNDEPNTLKELNNKVKDLFAKQDKIQWRFFYLTIIFCLMFMGYGYTSNYLWILPTGIALGFMLFTAAKFRKVKGEIEAATQLYNDIVIKAIKESV